MELIKSTCENLSCKANNLAFLGLTQCPICEQPLFPKFELINDETFKKVVQEYPAHVAVPVLKLFSTASWYKRLHYISDAVVGGLRLGGNLMVAKYLEDGNSNDELGELLDQIKNHETLGLWIDVLHKIYNQYQNKKGWDFLDQYAHLLGKSTSTLKKEKLFSVENYFTDEYGKIRNVKSVGTPLELLVNFRNRYLGHGAVISEEESEQIYNTYMPILSRFLIHTDFLMNYEWQSEGSEIKVWAVNFGDLSQLSARNTQELFEFQPEYPIYFEGLEHVISGKYHCNNSSCFIHQDHIGLANPQQCPNCQEELQLDEKELIDKNDELIIHQFPYVLAYPYQRALLEQEPYKKIQLLKETFLNYLKYLGLLVASEYFNSAIKDRKLNTNFRELLFRPQFGFWNKYIREGIQLLNEQNHSWFVKELPDYYQQIEIDPYTNNSGELTPIGQLIHFRNKFLGHGMVPSDKTSIEIWDTYTPILRKLILKMDFARKYTMISIDNLNAWRLMGVELPMVHNFKKSKNEDRVQLVNYTDERMNLVPFFVLPGEFFRQETSSRAKLMVYEQNTGKRIIFFSPESITDESSGKVLENLNQLLTNKEKEKPYSEKTFSTAIFDNSLHYRNAEVKRTLVNERKVIEGVYQEREDAEIELRSWIGARAGLFFIAADAGSGKTNLLFEMVNQYQERGIPSLLIRANRMTSATLEEELKYQFNLTPRFDIKKSVVFKMFTQENPLIILLDAGNEHPDPEILLSSILDFLQKHAGGNIKVVLTWRVSSRSSLPEIEVKYDSVVYSNGSGNEAEEKLLLKKCMWLKPLNKKELEGAWNYYTTNQAKTNKPQFTLEELTYHDRALTDQLQNPLMLRLFLELFHNKQLPKKKGFINIWNLYHNKVIQD